MEFIDFALAANSDRSMDIGMRLATVADRPLRHWNLIFVEEGTGKMWYERWRYQSALCMVCIVAAAMTATHRACVQGWQNPVDALEVSGNAQSASLSIVPEPASVLSAVRCVLFGFALSRLK
jgi:hypothetical protein